MFNAMIETLKANPRFISVVFTEGHDARILEATARLLEGGFLKPILVGNVEEVKANARATLTAETVRRLLARGAKLWNHPPTGATRVYLNGLARDLLDIEIDYYKTGNLRFFSMGGYKYSNCSGKRILCSLAKTWYDPEDGRIICDDKDLAADLEAAIANM